MGRTVIILCALVALSHSATLPKTQRTCSAQCTESKKFGYENGKTYEYDYTSLVSTSIAGASEDKAEINMAAKIHIEVQSKCDLVLRVSDVSLTESDPNAPTKTKNADLSGEFKRSLEKYPMMFSFQDGRIGELCPSENEEAWALNIKRAIISGFQNSMDDFSQDQKTNELDVTGSCDVSYALQSNGWYSMTIKKSKNMLGCLDRHSYRTAMQGTPYRVPSQIQSLPLVKSTHDCQQGISKSGILQSSDCDEEHVLRPFSRQSSGAVTKTKQTLKYVSESKGPITAVSVTNKASLTFDHTSDRSTSNEAQKMVIKQLKEICQSMKDTVKVSTATQFTELVKHMKSLDSSSMNAVHKQVHSGGLCPENKNVEKFFLDAIPMVGTQASLRMMTKLINEKEVTGTESDMWLNSLAFIQYPTKDMVLELKPLLTNTQNGQAMLAVSSMINNYCKTTSCDNDLDMVNLVSGLESTIGVGCFVDKNNVNNIIRTLRAFGNAGFSSSIPVVKQCLTRQDNPMEVRLAAAQAFRRMSCDADRDDLMAIYTNRDEDSELRIAAYLSLMRCPSKTLLNRVQKTLQSEEVNQVGSFVWTHLKNLMETSSPLKQSIKAILTNDILKKEFKLENLKYSKNYEASFFLEKINTGAAIDSNVIWSSKSFLPRSAMTNLTFDLFGHSVNLFEIGGRVEGLEYFLESYFGPDGYFGKVVKKEQNVKGISNKAMEEQSKQFGTTLEELKASMYLRIFGNELHYVNSDDVKSLIEGNNFNILDFIINLSKDQDYSFTQNLVFLDTSVVIPTMAGFPLKISVDGSATVNLHASGKMDLRQLKSNPMAVSVNGKIKPSAAVEVTSLMSIDAFVTKTGMKMVSSMNSATALEGHIELKGGQLFSVEWKTPEEKTEIFEARTSFFTVHRDTTREQKMITDNRQIKKVCTGASLAQVTGLEACAEISYPNASLKADSPYFPLTGPLTAGITLYKRDSHTSYKMEYKFAMKKALVMMNAEFNTPGSKIDREMKVGFDVNTHKQTVEMVMLSPWKKATFNGAVDKKDMKLNGKLKVDQSVYSLNAALDSSKKSSSMIYKPTLEIVIPKRENIKMDGTIQHAQNTFDAVFNLGGVAKEPIQMKVSLLNKRIIRSIKGSIALNKKEEYSFESRLQTLQTKKSLRYTPFLSMKGPSGEIMGLGGGIEVKYNQAVKVDLTVTGLTKSPMKYFVQVRDTGNAKQTRFQANMNIQTPLLTTKGRSNFIKRPTSIITRTNFDYVIPRVSRDKITMNSKVVWKSTKKVISVKGNSVLAFKKMNNLNLNIGGNFLSNAKLTKTNIEAQYGANKKDLNKKITLTSVVKHQLAWRASAVTVNAKLQHPESGIDLSIKGSHTHNKKSLDTTLTVSAGKQHTISSSVYLKDKSKKLVSISGGASMSWNKHSISLSNVFEQNNKQKYTNDVIAAAGKKKASVKSVFKLISDMEFDITNDISLPESKPFTVAGQLNRSFRNFKAGAQLGKMFSFDVATKYKPNRMIGVAGDVKISNRRITAEVEAENNHPSYSGKLDVKWDAENDKSKRVKVYGDIMAKDQQEISTKIEVITPVKQIAASYNHNIKNDINGHFDLALDGKNQINLDLNLADQKKGILSIKTPAENYKFKYETSSTKTMNTRTVDLIWGNNEKITLTLNMDQAMTIQQFQGSASLDTPFNGYRRASVEINHKFTDKLQSSLVAQMNGKKIQTDVEYNNGGFTDLQGALVIRTPFNSFKTASFNVRNNMNGDKYQSAVIVDLNGEIYKYEGEAAQRIVKDALMNNGNLNVHFADQSFSATWDHSHSTGEISTKLNTKVGKDVYQFDLKGRQALSIIQGGMSVSLMIKSPLMEDIQLSLDHQHRPSLIDSSVKTMLGDKTLLSGNVDYKRSESQTTFSHMINCRAFNMKGSVISDYKQFPVSGQINMNLNGKELDITGTYDRQQNNHNGKVKVNTPVTKPLTISFDLGTDNEVALSSSVLYGRNEMLATETRYRWDDRKLLKLRVVLPEQIHVDTSFKAHTGHASVYMEVHPVFDRVTLSSEWNTANGLRGKVRLDTPFKAIPYSQVTIDSKPVSGMTSSDIVIEFLPGQSIGLKSRHLVKGRRAEGSIDVTTPFTSMTKMSASFKHASKDNGIESMVSYTCPRGVRHIADISFVNALEKKMEINLKRNNDKLHMSGAVVLSSDTPYATLRVSSPFAEDIIVDLKQRKADEVAVTTGSLTYSGGKRIVVENRFRWNNAIVLTTSITTPYQSMSKVNAVFEAKGDKRSFSLLSSIEAQPITKKMLISGALNTYGSIDGNFRIETPFEAMPYSQVTLSSKRKGDLTTSTATIEYTPSKFVTVKVNHRMQLDNVEVTTEIKTPFKVLRHATATMKHTKDDNKGYVTTASFEYPEGKLYSADFSFNNKDKLEGSMALNSPVSRPISMSFLHKGKYPSLESHVELKYQGNQKHVFDLEFNNKGNFKTVVSYKCPSLDKISFEVTKKGNAKQFNVGAKAQYKKGESHEVELAFKNLAKMQGSLKVKSPFIDDVSASFHHTGSLSNLKSHLEYTYGKMKPATADVALISGKRLQGSLKVSHPAIDDISLNMIHKGKINNFRNKINLIYNKKDKISTDLNLKLAKVMKITLVLVTPFKGYKKVVANVKHEGNWKNFKCEAMVKKGKDTFKGEMRTSLGSKLTWESSVETPFNGWKKVSAIASHEGSMTNFKTHAELSRGKQSVASGDVIFAIKPSIDILIAAQTPFVGYKNVKASFKHTQSDTRVKTNAEVNFFKKDSVSMDMILNKASRNADLIVKTPFKGYERMTAAVSHTGDVSAFNTKLDFAVNKDKYSTEINFDTIRQLLAEIKLSSPVSFPSGELSLTHSGSYNNFRSRANARLFNKKHSADVSFNLLSGVEGLLELKSPYIDDIKASVTHKNEGKIKSSASLDYGKKNILNLESILGSKDSIFGTVTLKVINLPKIQGTFEHKGEPLNNKASAQVLYGKNKVSVEAEMNTKSDLDGKIFITTPFKSAETVFLSYSKSGGMRKLNAHMEAGINTDKITTDLTISNDDITTKAALTIDTPFSQLRQAEISTRFTGGVTGFDGTAKATINDKVAEVDLTSILERRVDIRTSVKTPFTKDLNIKLNHDGTLESFRCSMESSYGYDKLSGQVAVDSTNGLQVDAVIKTPFTQDIILASSTNKDIGDFKSMSHLSYNGAKQHQLEISFSSLADASSLVSSGQVTYNGKSASGKLDLSGSLENFRSYAEAKCMNKKASVELQFDITNGINGKTYVKTPVTSDLEIVFKHEGPMTNFNSFAKMSYGRQAHETQATFNMLGTLMKFTSTGAIRYNRKSVSFDATFDATNNVDGKLQIRTPVSEDVVIAFSNEGTPLAFKTSLKLTYTGKLQHDLSFVFNHDGSLENFDTNVAFTYNKQLASAMVNFNTENMIEGKVILKAPIMEDVIVAFSTEGSVKNSKTCLKVTYGGQLQHDLSLMWSFNGHMRGFNADSSLTYNNKRAAVDVTFEAEKIIEGKVTVKSPFNEDIIVHFSTEGSIMKSKTCLKVTYMGKLQHDFSLIYSLNGKMTRFNGNAALSYNNRVVSADILFVLAGDIEAKISVKTPFTEDMTVHFTSEGTLMTSKTCLKLTYMGKLQHEISFRYNFNGKMTSFTADTELTYNSKTSSVAATFEAEKDIEGKVTLRTPIMKDIIFHFSSEGSLMKSKSCLRITYSGKEQHYFKFLYNIEGKMTSFNGNAALSYNNQQAEVDALFVSEGDIEAKVTIKTPVTQDIIVHFTTEGSLMKSKSCLRITYSGKEQHYFSFLYNIEGRTTRFNGNAALSYNNQQAEVDALFVSEDDIEAKVTIKTPVTQDIIVHFTTEGSIRASKTCLKVTYMGKLQHDASLVLNMEPTLPNFNMGSSLRYNNKKASVKANLDTVNDIEGKITIQSPYNEDITVAFSSEGSLKNSKSCLKISYSGRLQHDISITGTFEGTVNHFTSRGEVTYNNKAASMEVAVSVQERMARIVFKSPFTNDITVNANCNGSYKRFASNIDISYGNKHVSAGTKYSLTFNKQKFNFQSEVSLNEEKAALGILLENADQYKASVSLSSPFTQDIEIVLAIQTKSEQKGVSTQMKVDGAIVQDVSLTLTNKMSDYQKTINLNGDYNGQSITGDFVMVAYNGFDIRLTLDTPISGYEQMSASALYEPQSKVQVTGRVGAQVIDIDATLESGSGKLSMKTPFTGMKDMSVNVNFNNNPMDFMFLSDAMVDSTKVYDLIVRHSSSSKGLEGSVSLKTAILDDISINYDISGNLMKSSASLSAAIGDSNAVVSNTIVDIQGTRQAYAKSSLDIIYTGIKRSGELELSASKSFSDFNAKLAGRFHRKEISLETVFKAQPSLEAMVKLQTPVTSMSAVVKNTMKANMMNNLIIVKLSPQEVYEWNINYLNQNMNKVDIKAEIKTPVQGHSLMRWIYRHDLVKNVNAFASYECSTGIKFVGDLKMSRKSVSLDISTPFEAVKSLSMKGNLEKQSQMYNLDTSMSLNTKTISLSSLVDLSSSPMTGRLVLVTPFESFKTSELRASCSGDITDLRSTLEINTPLFKPINSELRVRYASFLDMETTAILTTGFSYAKRLQASIINKKQDNEYQSHIETSWDNDKTLSVDASCDVLKGRYVKTGLSVSTPFQAIRSMKIKTGYEYSSDSNTLSVYSDFNGKKLVDLDLATSKTEQFTVSLVTRHPRPMNFRIGGNLDEGKSDSEININWNTDRADSNINVETHYTHTDGRCNFALRMVHPRQTVGVRGVLEQTNDKDSAMLDISVDNVSEFGTNYDCEHGKDERDTSLKFRFPSRSIMVNNKVQKRLGSKMVSNSLYWDADGDQTKKLTVRGELNPSDSGVDANIVLEMPSIGKDVELDSKVKVNKGSVLFDGRTSFKYSKDPSKTITLTSKVEDLSNGRDTNYNINFGVKHPFSTIDVEMTSQIQSSEYKKLASVDMKYMTVDRMTKNFGLMGEIDNLKKQLKLEVNTPIKSINIKGQVQTVAPYKVSIQNVIDDTKTMNAEFVVDPSDVSLDLNMNYDIENPQNVLHLNAKLSDETGLTAEIFRDVDQAKITETLVNLRLKTSRILHTKVHWNPDLIKTVKLAGRTRMEKYGESVYNTLKTVGAVEQEVEQKYHVIVAATMEDLQPYLDVLYQRIEELRQMTANNDYHLNDIATQIETRINTIRSKVEKIRINMESWSFNNMQYNENIVEAAKLIQMISLGLYSEMVNTVQKQLTELNAAIEQVYGTYGKPVTDSLVSLSNNNLIDTIKQRIPEIPLQSMADKYNSAIYNAREVINSNLINTLPTPVYNMASSAYKHWEIEENIYSVFSSIVNIFKQDIQEEFSNIKDLILDIKKTKITVYDPKKGNFEMDIYLPLEMKSLTQIKRIINPLENLKSLIPQPISLPSLGDMWEMAVVPKFGAHASIEGDHFITFDGQQFNFKGRCSYVLARDFGKDKFSIILNYMAKQQKKMIVMTSSQNVQVMPSGNVRVDGARTTLPYVSQEVRVSQVGENVYIEGNGFSVVNNIKTGTYDVQISHWFHGRTAGLLGYHDNERFDDMMTSDRQITSDVTALAKSWQVQEKCA